MIPTMAKHDKRLLRHAKAAKAAADREARQQAERAVLEAPDAASQAEALDRYEQLRQQQRAPAIEMQQARQQAREAKQQAGSGIQKPKRLWGPEGRAALQAVRRTKQSEFSLARVGELVTFSRDVDRWETLKPYDNARGVKRGEVAMVVGDKYFYIPRLGGTGDGEERQCCDVMVGGQVILGIPVTVLRPVEGADSEIPNDSKDLEQP